jgi:hypothetical protein
MAQVVKLKRTAVEGKVPSTQHLELGELAINTHDGRIFFQKDDGTPTIQHIVTTNSVTTGSISLIGDVTASNLQLNGNATINGNLTLGGNITIGDSTSDTITISADLSSSIIPDLTDTFDLGSSSKKWNKLYVVTASADYFIGDGSQLTGISADVSQVATITASFQNQSSISVTHNFNSKNVIISVYGSNDSQIIPQSVVLTDNNTTTIGLSGPHSGYVVVAKGGHIVSGSVSANNISGLESKIIELTSYNEIVSGNSTYSIIHNLDEEYPLVQAWNTTTKRQEQPSIIESISSNEVSISFAGSFSGKIIIKK